jgi:hypothetical protein
MDYNLWSILKVRAGIEEVTRLSTTKMDSQDKLFSDNTSLFLGNIILVL